MTEKYYRIIVDSGEAKRKVGEFDDSMRKAGKGADKLDFKVNKLSGAIKGALVGGAIAAAVVGLKKAAGGLVDAQRKFDKLNASLITATGSSEGAETAFAAIEQLAAKTPYSVNAVTESFIKLRNLGLDPSEEAIISYGNTAAAMGKDLDQLIEAVADATTGEFERLKEFGIKSRNEGKQIAFTFQGTTKRIENNAEAIQNYLRSLGDEQFAGAVDARMRTLDGAISNLGDSWEALVRTVNASGISSIIEDSVRLATDSIGSLNDSIRSGELQAYFGAIGVSFEGFAKDFTAISNSLLVVYRDLTQDIGDKSGSITGFLGGAFVNALPNIRAFIQTMTVEVAGAIDKTIAYGGALKSFFTDFDFSAANEKLEGELKRINNVRRDSIDSILIEHSASVNAVSEQIEKAKQLGFEYEKTAGKKAGALGQFGIKGEGDANAPQDTSQTDYINAQTATLKDQLNKRKEIYALSNAEIAEGYRTHFDQQRAMLQKNIEEDLLAEDMRLQAKLDKLQFQQAKIQENNTLSDQQKLDRIAALDSQELILKDLHEQTLTEIEEEGSKSREQIARAEAQSRLQTMQSALGALSTLMNSESKKQFKIGQKAAIANTVISTYESAQKSYNSLAGIPYVGPVLGGIAAAAAVAAGLARVKSIKSRTFGGGSTSISNSSPSVGASGGGGGAGIPATGSSVAREVNQRKSFDIRIQPGLYTHEQMRDLARGLAGDDESIATMNSATRDAERRGVIAE